MISRKIASQHPDAQGKPKKVGDTLRIGGKPFQDRRPLRDRLDDS